MLHLNFALISSALLLLQSLAKPLDSRWTLNPAEVLKRQSDSSSSSSSSLFSCAAASWPPITAGQANTPQQPSADLQSMLAQVSSSNIQNTILKLVSFGTRHTLSPQNNATYGIGGARDWIRSEFERYANASDGRLTVAIDSYTQQPDGDRVPFPTVISNVVATLKGTEQPERVYVVSGHYDSRCTDPNDYTSDAPGADDDASGVAISLELARIISLPNYPLPLATLVFVAVAGEEQGLYGSTHLAQVYRNTSTNVEGMFTNDIVGSPRGDPGTFSPNTIRLFAQGIPPNPTPAENSTQRTTRLTVGGENDTPPRNLARFVAEVAQSTSSTNTTNMSIATVYRTDRYLRGGDHRPFLDAGFPAARFTEPHENFAHQHQDVRVDNATGIQYGDLPQFCDYEYIARVGRVNLATMWSLAVSPGMPTNVRINTTILTNDSTFYWEAPAGGDANVEAYEVVYRPTDAPEWTGVVDVGLVHTATVSVSKDNVVFGVRARAKGGFRGVAVFPFPVA